MDFAYPVSRKAFMVTAIIDWLDVTISTSRPTQFRRLQETFTKADTGKLHITPLDKGAGGIATTFRIRFRDDLANDYTALRAAIEKVSKHYPLTGEPSISGIEVSIDFKHKGPPSLHIRDTLAMTYRLQSSLFVRDARKPRQYDPEIKGNRFMDVEGARLDPGLNFRIGNKSDAKSWQVYFKSVDNKRVIPQKDWRARVEVTLQGEALGEKGLSTLSDLEGYDFGELSNLFKFRQPKAPERQAKGDLYRLTAILALRRLRDATPARGMHSFDKLGRRNKWRKTREESSHIEADEELQKAVRDALGRLSV